MKHWMTVLMMAMCLAVGCERRTSPTAKPADDESESLSPEEQRLVDAARPFIGAVVQRQYVRAHTELSRHAIARMSLNQFMPEEDDDEYEKNEKSPMTGVTASVFAELMAKVEAQQGEPRKLIDLHVNSTDPQVLSGKSTDLEGKLDAMFAIGAMPDTVPAQIRRASLRGQIGTELSEKQLADVAKSSNTTVEELRKDPDFSPYFNFKLVLVDEDGRLKVGYFEFMPASMLD